MKSMRRTFVGSLRIAVIVAIALASVLASTGSAAEQRADLDSLLDRAMASQATPGISIAVVQGDRIVWRGARGWADREARRPVTSDTRFYIASTTKALTATAVACVAARGQLDLDAPVSRALPLAKFHPGVHADSIRVVDLLTHTHGIDSDGPVSVRVAYTGDYTYADLYRGLATQGPAETGHAFQYSNLGYDLAGILLDPAHKGGWKTVVEREVTGPLGMTATTAYRSRVNDARLAMPYDNTVDGFAKLRFAKQDANMGPAGGMFSTSDDLARLVIAELNRGRVDGRACIPAEVIANTQRARVPQRRQFQDYPRFAWGLGWDLGTYDRDTLVHRFGSFPGFGSHVSFMPSKHLGVVVLVNNNRTGMVLADVLANAVYDALRGRADTRQRMEAELDTLATRAAKLRDAVAEDRARRAARSQQLAHPLAAYAGDYVNDDWGTLRLRTEGGRLHAEMGVAQSDVEVYDAATNKLRVELFGGGDVLEMVFTEGASRAAELRLENATYRRK